MAKVINSIRLLNLARQRVKDCGNEVVELDESPEGKALYLTFLSVEHLYRLGAITKEQRNETEAEYEEYYQQSAGRAIRRDLLIVFLVFSLRFVALLFCDCTEPI